MKFLAQHCDYIRWKVRKRVKNSFSEEPEIRERKVEDCLVLFLCVEYGDLENGERMIGSAAEEIDEIAKKLKVRKLVIFPFAHLFPDGGLEDPILAFEMICRVGEVLKSKGYEVERVPFGWYKMYELKCKGHPLSVLSRVVRN